MLQHIRRQGIIIESTEDIKEVYKMHVIVKKWGNSASVRIPVAIMKAVSLSLDETVDVREEGGRIVIEPVRNTIEYDLAQLLAGITPENLHAEVDYGPAVGKEAF
jgi:antitoxin MazE